MKIFLAITLILTSLYASAQNRVGSDLTPEYKELIYQLDDCTKSGDKNCLDLVEQIIKKGEQEKVPFLDFLYFKKAYYYWQKSEIDSTMVYAKLSLQNPNPKEKHKSDIEANNLMGLSHYFKGNFKIAMEYYLKNAAILENGDDPIKLGYLYTNLAGLHGQLYDYDKQIAYLLKSFKLLDDNNEEQNIALTASSLAQAYYRKEDTINAIKWAQKTLSLSEKSNNLRAKTVAYLALTLTSKEKDEILTNAEKAVFHADKLQDKKLMTSAYFLYSDILNELNQPQKALSYAEQAVGVAEEIGDNMNLLGASLVAGNINYTLDQKEKAADFYHKYVNLKDSITAEENAKISNEIYTKYETEKKEKQIVQQEFKIQKQQSNLLLAILSGVLLVSVLGGSIFYNKKKQESKLKQLQKDKENAILNSFILGEERERNRISQELHDGVAAMIGAAKMSLESIPHLSEEKGMEQISKVKKILENTHADVRRIAHNLLPTVLEKEGLIKATTHFAFEINETKLVKISVKGNTNNSQKLSPQLQLMLFRVIQELVNNIIKHSQAQNAEITFSNSLNGLQIEISDDGIGYDDTNTTENQGLYSITQRLKSIGGNFKITKRKSGGTQAEVMVTV